ncbi:hypothetical protein B7494_g7633 [Chlorociboria aeruginascens]|nr:hypothetical protein B7494_g7633 [Chlorociboria aeruginascens]
MRFLPILISFNIATLTVAKPLPYHYSFKTNETVTLQARTTGFTDYALLPKAWQSGAAATGIWVRGESQTTETVDSTSDSSQHAQSTTAPDVSSTYSSVQSTITPDISSSQSPVQSITSVNPTSTPILAR